MVIDKQAQDAVNTIIEYCGQRHEKRVGNPCINCPKGGFCDEIYDRSGWGAIMSYKKISGEGE